MRSASVGSIRSDAGVSPGKNVQEIGQPTHPYPGGVRADIWVFSGQSNSQGWGLLKAPVEPDPRVMFFNADNHWVLAEEPLNKRFYTWTPPPVDRNILLQRDDIHLPQGLTPETFLEQQVKSGRGPLGGVGAGLFFAKHLLKTIDRPIGLVYCGVGGSPIKAWDPGQKSKGLESSYGAMMNRIALVGGEIKGIVWYQGESDAMTPGKEDAYEQALLHLIDSIRSDAGIPDLPFLCVQIARFVWADDSRARGFEKIRDIQRRAPSLRKGVYSVSALDLPLEDSAHIGFEGHRRLGARLAEIALTGVYHQPGHATPIDLDSIEVLQAEARRATVRVRFRGVNGSLRAPGLPTGFELRSAQPSRDAQSGSDDRPIHVIYRVDLDPNDPAAVILGVFDNTMINTGGRKFHPLTEPFSLVYGPGMSPYVNIVDAKDIPIPAFGPVEVNPSH